MTAKPWTQEEIDKNEALVPKDDMGPAENIGWHSIRRTFATIRALQAEVAALTTHYKCAIEIEEYKPGAWEVTTSKGLTLGFIEPQGGQYIALDSGFACVKGEYAERDDAIRALLASIGLDRVEGE